MIRCPFAPAKGLFADLARIVLLTNNLDESFEEYSVLRPIELAQGE